MVSFKLCNSLSSCSLCLLLMHSLQFKASARHVGGLFHDPSDVWQGKTSLGHNPRLLRGSGTLAKQVGWTWKCLHCMFKQLIGSFTPVRRDKLASKFHLIKKDPLAWSESKMCCYSPVLLFCCAACHSSQLLWPQSGYCLDRCALPHFETTRTTQETDSWRLVEIWAMIRNMSAPYRLSDFQQEYAVVFLPVKIRISK